MTKDLDYYLSLDYDVFISKRETDGEVVYKAYARELDQFVFYGAGDSKAEALESFERTRKELFRAYLEEGREIPEPRRETEVMPSGRFVLRISPNIHYRLICLARDSAESLNSYVKSVLDSHVAQTEVLEAVSRNWSMSKHNSIAVRTFNLRTRGEANLTNDKYQSGYSSEIDTTSTNLKKAC